MHCAAAAYESARGAAEQHSVAGERATCQAQRAFVLAFTDPDLADDELDLAQRLLSGLDLGTTRLTTQIAALLSWAGGLLGAGGDHGGDHGNQHRRPGQCNRQRLGEHRAAVHHVGETAREQQADQDQQQDDQQGKSGHSRKSFSSLGARTARGVGSGAPPHGVAGVETDSSAFCEQHCGAAARPVSGATPADVPNCVTGNRFIHGL